jgi:hypothetical protein
VALFLVDFMSEHGANFQSRSESVESGGETAPASTVRRKSAAGGELTWFTGEKKGGWL